MGTPRWAGGTAQSVPLPLPLPLQTHGFHVDKMIVPPEFVSAMARPCDTLPPRAAHAAARTDCEAHARFSTSALARHSIRWRRTIWRAGAGPSAPCGFGSIPRACAHVRIRLVQFFEKMLYVPTPYQVR